MKKFVQIKCKMKGENDWTNQFLRPIRTYYVSSTLKTLLSKGKQNMYFQAPINMYKTNNKFFTQKVAML